jgi:RNase H-like domain found in reverse transcriptase
MHELERITTISMLKPVLVAPKHDRDFIIMCDATNFSVAAILAQKDDRGVERNVAYYSRKLLPREQNCFVIEKQCLAIMASCLHWHNYRYIVQGC